ncbi:unnamed protein product [Effrenium voratum]|uniref:Uncharacterized protein n=1 Tax=Effrenium voratum TaxID=2562239 RepID=A0AA36MVY5_9DINO|nr:unnamed protein product [Effrenium voratum]
MAKRQQPLPLLPRCLRTEGVRTVPIFPDAEESRVSRKALRRELLQALQEFPEFLPGAEKLVLGSFGALGNPSSFHHPAVRRCRLLCMRPGLRLFRDFLATVPSKLGPRAPRRLELLWDRLCLRRPGDKMSGETAHRDLARFKLPEDEIFGGWLNLDSRSQFFHCVPGSHEDADQLPGQGFCREQTSRCMRRVEVPPGHLLVFYQNILHEVQKDSVAHTSLRLFVGWRLTRSTLSLQDLAARTQPGVLNTKALTTQQGLPLLPSGQKPPMYAKNHWCFWQKGLVAWSDGNLRECCKERLGSLSLNLGCSACFDLL